MAALMQDVEIDYLVDNVYSGSRVCEIGTWTGESMLRLKLKRPDLTIVSIDNLSGGEGNPRFTWKEYGQLLENIKTSGNQLFVGTTAQYEGLMGDRPTLFDHTIVDGSHDYQSVLSDLYFANRFTKLTGYIYVHDYLYDQLPQVKAAADEFMTYGTLKHHTDIGITRVYWKNK